MVIRVIVWNIKGLHLKEQKQVQLQYALILLLAADQRKRID